MMSGKSCMITDFSRNSRLLGATQVRATQVRASIIGMLCHRLAQSQLGTLDAPYSTSTSRPLWLRGFLMRRISWAVPQALVCALMQASPVWLSRGLDGLGSV